MKKLFALTLTIVALGLFAAGCSKAAKETKTGTDTKPAAVQSGMPLDASFTAPVEKVEKEAAEEKE